MSNFDANPLIAKLQRARAQMITSQPFFAQLALRVDIKLSTRTRTADIDGKTIRFNPDYVETAELHELKTLWAHEVMHCATGQVFRLRNRDLDTWNRACDYVINPIIRDAGFELPAWMLFRDDLQAMSADQAYRVLMGEKQNEQEQGDEQEQPSPSPQGDDSGPSDGGSDPGEDNSPSDDRDTSSDAESDDSGDTETGPVDEYGEHAGGMRAPSDDDGNELADAGKAEAEMDWLVATVEAAQVAQAAGKLPGGVRQMVRAVKRVQTDWKAELREYITARRRDDYSMRRPNRRYLSQGLILPSLYSETVGHVILAIDISASILRFLPSFGNHLNAILDDVRPELLTVIYCDAAIQKEEEFGPLDYPVTLDSPGGGGTSFAPVFDKIADERLSPDLVIYLTDLEVVEYGPEPECPVIWASIAKPSISDPPFGDVLLIDLE